MSSRREEKERLRQARIEAERAAAAADRRRLWLGYLVAGVLASAVLVGIVMVIAGGGDGDDTEGTASASAGIDHTSGVVPEGIPPDERNGTELPDAVSEAVGDIGLEQAADAAGCRLQQDLEDEGATHIPEDSEIPDYRTSPPSSGDHAPQPLADGAYLEQPSPLLYVHALEHGRIELQYDPDLPESDQLAIKGLFDIDPNGMLLFPNADMDATIAAVAWTQLMTCESFEGEATLTALLAFRDAYRGRGPEPIPL